MTEHERWMEIALREAQRALSSNEVPVGAVVVYQGTIIGKGYNQIESLHDSTAHAEMIAVTAASDYLNSKWLEKCTLYVTLEPCIMCTGALVLARIPMVVFGAYDPKAGACGTLYNIAQDPRLNHRIQCIGGVLDDRCGLMLKEFFAMRRMKGKE
jgi:tRNA(adenine34) deaminase